MKSGGKEASEGGQNRGSRLVEELREETWRTYGKMEGAERNLEGGGKCQMVGLRLSMSDGRLQKDGC